MCEDPRSALFLWSQDEERNANADGGKDFRVLSTICAGNEWQGPLTIDWCEPENDFMKEPRSKGTDNAHHAEKRNGEQNCLERIAIGQVSASSGLRGGYIPYGEYE